MKVRNIIIIILSCILVDQFTKYIISTFFNLEQRYEIIKNFYYLTYYKNSGIAFGMFENGKIIIIVVSLLLLLLLIYELKNFYKNRVAALSFCLLIGGLIGNLIDRIFLGYVRDFLEFDIFNINFPIFNISDACIVVGAIILIISSFGSGNKNANIENK